MVGQEFAAVDEAQSLLRVGLRQAGADEVLERDDGGLVRVWDVEEDVVYRGGEADGQEERRRGWRGWRRGWRRRRQWGRVDDGWWCWSRGAIVAVMIVVWKALLARSFGRRRRGPVGAPASAHLVGDDVGCRVRNTIFCVWAGPGDCMRTSCMLLGGLRRKASFACAILSMYVVCRGLGVYA